jgi:acetyl-CoA carboxylase biotin carboxyl carrier protein
MKLREIRALVQLLEQSGLSVLEVSRADTKIRLEKSVSSQQVSAASLPAAPQPQAVAAHMDGAALDEAVDFNKITEVTSPMVGVFYAGASPDAPPFVELGSRVKKGDVLCIVEAMKLMNEITADRDGEIVDICVENGQVVEYAQILFKIF